MALPITVPFTFGNATTTQSLSSLDADFSTVYNAVNGIGNGTVVLANVTITGGSINNVSLGNAISVSAIQNGNSKVDIPLANGNVVITTNSSLALTVDTNHNIIGTANISDSIGNVRTVPINSQSSGYVLISSDSGKFISITTGGVTIPSNVFTSGQSVSIYNDSTSSQTITQGSGATLYQVGTVNTGNRTLAQRGLCTVLCVGTNTFVITGGGLT
jgi:hypothetical protein